MESARLIADAGAEQPGFVAGRPLEEWNAAYAKVEAYFQALGVRNKLLLSKLVSRVIDHAIERAPLESERVPMDLAAEEMERVVTDWFAAILEVPPSESNPLTTIRGRMALLLADMPNRWQDQFLKDGPWPEEFVEAMRKSYLRAGPDFHLSEMDPRPIDLGPIITITELSRIGWVRMLATWLLFAVALIIIFQITR